MRKNNDIYFIGRETEYDNIEKWLFEEIEDQKPYVVSGPNDIGKSTLLGKVLEYNRDQIKQNAKMIYLKEISLMHYRDEEEFFEVVYDGLETELQNRLRELKKGQKDLDALKKELESLEHFEESEECLQWMAKLQAWADRLHELNATEYAQYESELASWEQRLVEIRESLPARKAEWEQENSRQAQIKEQMMIWEEILGKLNNEEEGSTIRKNLSAAMGACADQGIRVIMPIDEFDYADDREKYSDDYFRVLTKWKNQIRMVLISRKKLSRISDTGGTVEKQFSELFEPIVLRGFDNEELKAFFDARFQPIFDAYPDKVDVGERKEIEKKILYYCGRHPRLLSDMQKAVEGYLKRSKSVLLDGEKLEDILPQEMKSVFDRLYDLMRYEMDGQENGENLVELYLKCFGMISCDEKESYWLELLYENGYITKRKSDEVSLEKLFGFDASFDAERTFPECDGYEPISAYSLEHIRNRYLRDQKKSIREDIQSIIDTTVNSEEYQEAIEEAARLKEAHDALMSKIATLEQSVADLEQANEDLLGEWESADARREAIDQELQLIREEKDALEIRYLEKEEELDQLYQNMETEVARRIEEQKKEWGEKAHLTTEEMLKEILQTKAGEEDIRVLLGVMKEYGFDGMFENAVFAHYLVTRDITSEKEADFDYVPAVIMYFKLYEGILKECHFEIYRSRLGSHVTDIKRRRSDATGQTFAQLATLSDRNKRMTMGTFFVPITDQNVQPRTCNATNIMSLADLNAADANSVLSDEYKWWTTHWNRFEKIYEARNDLGAHYESRNGGKVTKQKFDELVRILFPTTPKNVNQRRNDGALILACDLRALYDWQSAGQTGAYKRKSEEIRAALQAALQTVSPTDQN